MTSTPEARRRLETDFWNALNRPEDEKEPAPARAAGLPQKMDQATAICLNDKLSLMRSRLFRLTPQQWNTLQEAGMTCGQANLLGRLDHRVKAVHEYEANDLLEAIASIPENPDGWRRWWTENARLANRLNHGKRSNGNKPDNDLENLRSLINLISRAAAGSIPEPAEAAATPGPPEKLSEALKRVHRVKELAAALDLSPQECGYGELTPDAVNRELEERGIRCEPDIGTLASPEELGTKPGWPGADGFECDFETNLWWRRESTPPDGKRYIITGPYREMDGAEISQAEMQLIRFTAPVLPDGRPDGLGALALHNGLTRRQARQLLEGETPDPERPAPCPMAIECPTTCGEAQRREMIRFPPTGSGGYEECGYYRFLLAHRNSPLREQAAMAEAEKIIAAAKRTRREIEQEEDGPEETPREKRETKAKEPERQPTLLGL